MSKALEINLACSRVKVELDPAYGPLLEIASGYQGLRDRLTSLLEEVCHPYKNWRFVVEESRRFCLNNYHLFQEHPRGPEGLRLFLEIFLRAEEEAKEEEVRASALDNALVLLQTMIDNSSPDQRPFWEVTALGLTRLAGLAGDRFKLVLQSFYQVSDLARALAQRTPDGVGLKPALALLTRYLDQNLAHWLAQPDPRAWFLDQLDGRSPDEPLKDLFRPISHETLRTHRAVLEKTEKPADGSPLQVLKELTALPGYKEIVAGYERTPKLLEEAGREQGQGLVWKLIFLFHIMNIPGLSSIHERVLSRINRTLSKLISRQDQENIQSIIADTFRILKRSIKLYPQTALHCALNMGRAVYRTGDPELIEFFLAGVAELGFQPPGLAGVGDDWEIRANQAHVDNIRTWLGLIQLNPAASRKLISALVVHLAGEGVFIKDTDLFPREVTALLNAEVSPVYNLIKQLCRLFPVYFNEIGAEGRLRDISTELDEATGRGDPLVHFLRKQSHVSSSPQTVALIKGALDFWRTRDKEGLKGLIPPRTMALVQSQGPLVDGLHRLLTGLAQAGLMDRTEDLLGLSEAEFGRALARIKGGTAVDRRRLKAAQALYRLLHRKYHADLVDLSSHLEQLRLEVFPDLTGLIKALEDPEPRARLVSVLDQLDRLKAVILSPERFEVREDIYHKRHVAVDIPSMYGSYHEPKFDALGLTFRLESLANTLFQEIIDDIDLELITRAGLARILDIIRLFDRGLKLDGINTRELEGQIDLLGRSLDIRGFGFTQYQDIFRGISRAVGNIVADYFNSVHQNQLVNLVGRVPVASLLPKFRPPLDPLSPQEAILRVSEIFLRDRIATSLGLQQLDGFVGRIMTTLFQQSRELPQATLPFLLNYDPDKAATLINPVEPKLADIIRLGNKGFNLVRISTRGLPVPPGFIVTTDVFRSREVIRTYPPARENFRRLIRTNLARLESLTGRRLGDPRKPLLLSVRSGSSISQPGMLSTFLNVGMNQGIAAGMGGRSREGKWFAWDCYRRFLQTAAMAKGLKRDDFDAIISEFKLRLGLPFKKDFSGEQMKDCALAYLKLIMDHGLTVEEEPFEQLEQAILGVFGSWESEKARTYRRIMDISDDWGTAVTVQVMVFGNLSQQSGSGVLFTHNPRWSGDKLQLWGDFTLGNQGEDVVSGLVQTLPLTRRQAEIENRSDKITLERNFTEIYTTLEAMARNLIEEAGFSPQEMEFTFEGPRSQDLYFLQSRDMSHRDQQPTYSPELARPESARLIGHGIGVSGGRMTGRIVFSLGDMESWRAREPEKPLILVRNDTVPEDIREIFEADGLLTARGGSTSHAAIVAHRLNKTCVVGCAEMSCDERTGTCTLGRETLTSSDRITIDGRSGSVFTALTGGGSRPQPVQGT